MSDESHSKPQPERTYEKKCRQCLMCREPFISEWPGERVCRKCKSTNAWREGQAA
jgi:hypothetical protein